MIISVKYKNKWMDRLSSRAYSYRCDIPGIRVGDAVIAPTARGDNEAVVVEVDVPEERLDDWLLAALRTITQRKEEAKEVPTHAG